MNPNETYLVYSACKIKLINCQSSIQERLIYDIKNLPDLKDHLTRSHLTRVTSHPHLKGALLPIGWASRRVDTSAARRLIVEPQAASANQLFPRGELSRRICWRQLGCSRREWTQCDRFLLQLLNKLVQQWKFYGGEMLSFQSSYYPSEIVCI